ncbi:ubiquitin-binding protein cue5 [Ascosphaera aggregata]|nr:ubiquitin-binding protein cue5 [Ascosphaera aggregata]
MSDKQVQGTGAGSTPSAQEYGVESPTTAQSLSFDDDVNEPTAQKGSYSTSSNQEDAPPAKPPRPLTAQQQAEKTLREAFPAIDQAVVKAVLVASGGDVERSFHALLGMSDPSAQEEDIPPPKPRRPTPSELERQRQLEADENYARMLAEQYGDPTTSHYSARGQQQDSNGPRPVSNRERRETGLKPNELYDDDHDFFRDDLPVIQKNIKKGFMETQTKVNSFFASLKKKFDGEEDMEDESEYYGDQPRRQYGQGSSYNRYRRAGERMSGERDRYDADARELGDGFSALELRDTEGDEFLTIVPSQRPRLPRRPPRPAHPDMFSMDDPNKPERRKVSFHEGPPEEIPSSVSSRKSEGGSRDDELAKSEGKGTPPPIKTKKWQPLSVVEPSPIVDTDPFRLGDSDDEKEVLRTKEEVEDKTTGSSTPPKPSPKEEPAGEKKKKKEGGEEGKEVEANSSKSDSGKAKTGSAGES